MCPALVLCLSLTPLGGAAPAALAAVPPDDGGGSYHQEVTGVPGAPPAPDVTAASAALMDVSSGRVLYAKNGHVRRAPASLTKVATALVALEAGDLDSLVEVSAAAAGIGGSSIWLEAGEQQTLRDLLYGLMLRSGNDAAAAIAEHVGGTVDHFVYEMNRLAARVGAGDTHFRNPHGLPALGHYSSALDMALLAREGLLRSDFRELVSTRRYVMPWPGHPWDRAVYNENRLLWLYPGADGVKTGWTEEAGRCLIASATRDGWQLVAVVLHAPDMWADATELLDWGFSSFESRLVCRAGEEVAQVRVAGAAERWVPLATARDVRIALLAGGNEGFRVDPDVPPYVTSPVAEGETIGTLRVVVGGEALGNAPLVSLRPVAAGGLVGQFLQDVWVLLRNLFDRLLGAPGPSSVGRGP